MHVRFFPLVVVLLVGHVPGLLGDVIRLVGPGAGLVFEQSSNRLALVSFTGAGQQPILFANAECTEPGGGPTGNLLGAVVRGAKYNVTSGMADFHVVKVEPGERRLRAYLEHDSVPLLVGFEVSVEGSVVKWLGQALWNGDEAVEVDIYFPLLSRVKFDSPQKDRAIFPQTSGSVREPLGAVNYVKSYAGPLASPVFLVEGGGRGLAWLDDNRSDYAPDPGATCLRAYLAANEWPLGSSAQRERGPVVGVRHTRVFQPISTYGGEASYQSAEAPGGAMPFKKLGDAVDLGPIYTYAYQGSWKVGADWLRQQRSWVPFRVAPGKWYQRTTFIGEEGGGALNGKGGSFYGLPAILEEKRKLGVDVFFITGFSDSEVVGTSGQSRGDYFLAAQHFGGFEALQPGMEALHRAGGRLMYYIEGMIVWKRSRIGRSAGQEWALMERDGRYTEHYRGFWHACPAYKPYQDWLAQTCAEILRTTGIDGFFIDSTLATYNHRCFNPAHKHPHPDVWNWGVRQMLKRVREEIDKVNPEAVIFVEGCGDLGREHADGFVAHSHFWTENTFKEPLVRFLHPDMRAYESWGYVPRNGNNDTLKRWFLWNCVQGYRVYAHNASREPMAELSRLARRYYDSFPEICDSPMSLQDVSAEGGIAQLFDGPPRVITAANPSSQEVEVILNIPGASSILFDRVDAARIPVQGGRATVKLAPWAFKAFEIRP